MAFPRNQTNFEQTFAAKVTFLKGISAEEVTSKKVVISGDSETTSLIVRETSNLSTLSVSNQATASNLNITGITTVSNIEILGHLKDGDGDFGTAGQVLSSDGTDTKWINTSDANVGSATNVGTNENGDDSSQYVTFVSAKSGNNPIRVDEGIKYNPSTNVLTVGSLSLSGASSGGIIPSGGIIMWSGAINAIPSGWALCDGQNNTPDLRDRFVVGAGDSYSVNATGGANTVTLTVDEMPSHTHLTANSQTGTAVDYPTGAGFMVTGNNGNTSSSTGGNQPHENRPPYYALAYIMKT